MRGRFLAVLVGLVMTCATSGRAAEAVELPPETFLNVGKNDFLILQPNYQWTYEDDAKPKANRLTIVVLDESKKLGAIDARAVERRESAGGKVVKTTKSYFAIEKGSGDVHSIAEDGTPSLYLSAKPVLSQKSTLGEVVSLSEPVKVPAGQFANCIRIDVTIEGGEKQSKFYARTVGLVIDGKYKLVRHGAKKPAPKSVERLDAEPIVPIKIAREALGFVGSDAYAEEVWLDAINDPALTAGERSDLIEDLNEEGFATFGKPTIAELPLVLSRLDLIERYAGDAMDEVNAAAFAEAHKDLVNIANRLAAQLVNP